VNDMCIADTLRVIANESQLNKAERESLKLIAKEWDKLQAENKELLERIEFAVDYLPECPDKAKSFLITALKEGE